MVNSLGRYAKSALQKRAMIKLISNWNAAAKLKTASRM